MFSYSQGTRKHTHGIVQKATITSEDQQVHLLPVLLLLPAMWSLAWRSCSDLSWVYLSHPLETLAAVVAPLLLQVVQKCKRKKKQTNRLICCKISLYYRHCAGKLYPEGTSFCLQHTEMGKEEKAQKSSACLGGCPPAADLRQCRDVVTPAVQGRDTFVQSWEQADVCGDPLRLWVHFSHILLLPRRVLGNFGISHFPVEVIALHSLIYCISQGLFLGGRAGGGTKLLGQLFSINALSLFTAPSFT